MLASQDAGTSAYGPYTGVAPTLAAANNGYKAGGPGAVAGYTPWTPSNSGGSGLFGFNNFTQAPFTWSGASGPSNTIGNAASKVL